MTTQALGTIAPWHPVLFSGAMVNAILRSENPKTQTRRVVKPQFGQLWGQGVNHGAVSYSIHVDIKESDGSWAFINAPHGKAGDGLWLRESAYIAPPNFGRDADANLKDDEGRPRVVGWAASMDSDSIRTATDYGVKCTPSIFMPRWASRISLLVKSIRVERLQDISESDAIAEGVEYQQGVWRDYQLRTLNGVATARESFQSLWDSINAKRGYGWDTNCFVWVTEFERIVP